MLINLFLNMLMDLELHGEDSSKSLTVFCRDMIRN